MAFLCWLPSFGLDCCAWLFGVAIAFVYFVFGVSARFRCYDCICVACLSCLGYFLCCFRLVALLMMFDLTFVWDVLCLLCGVGWWLVCFVC